VEIACFLAVADLPSELESDSTGNRATDAQGVLTFERACPEWFPFVPGFAPQWHADRRDMLRLEQERRDFERRLTRDRLIVGLLVATLIVTLIGALFAALSYFALPR
jgi:hypothetical protein